MSGAIFINVIYPKKKYYVALKQFLQDPLRYSVRRAKKCRRESTGRTVDCFFCASVSDTHLGYKNSQRLAYTKCFAALRPSIAKKLEFDPTKVSFWQCF